MCKRNKTTPNWIPFGTKRVLSSSFRVTNISQTTTKKMAKWTSKHGNHICCLWRTVTLLSNTKRNMAENVNQQRNISLHINKNNLCHFLENRIHTRFGCCCFFGMRLCARHSYARDGDKRCTTAVRHWRWKLKYVCVPNTHVNYRGSSDTFYFCAEFQSRFCVFSAFTLAKRSTTSLSKIYFKRGMEMPWVLRILRENRFKYVHKRLQILNKSRCDATGVTISTIYVLHSHYKSTLAFCWKW